MKTNPKGGLVFVIYVLKNVGPMKKYKNNCRTLKKIHDEAKSKSNLNKFMEKQGNSKKKGTD